MTILEPEDLLQMPDSELATYFSGGYGPKKRKIAVQTVRFLAEKHLSARGKAVPKRAAGPEVVA